MKKGSNKEFNFRQAILGIKCLEEFMQEIDFFSKKEAKLDKKYTFTSCKFFILGLWLLITLLSAGIVGLSYFAYLQYRENQRLIAENKAKVTQVAGINESSSLNIISGENFSILVNQDIPAGFILLNETKDWEFWDGQKSTLSSFFFQKNYDGKNLISGIKINSLEFDNKNDRETFDKIVLDKLGDGWVIKSQDIHIPNNIKLSKLENKEGKAYYTTVTAGYYYVIQIENQTQPYPEFKEVSQFVDKFLANLYLN